MLWCHHSREVSIITTTATDACIYTLKDGMYIVYNLYDVYIVLKYMFLMSIL